jgi:hypothetical protein
MSIKFKVPRSLAKAVEMTLAGRRTIRVKDVPAQIAAMRTPTVPTATQTRVAALHARIASMPDHYPPEFVAAYETPDQIEARLAVLRAELATIPPDTAAYCRLVASREIRSLEIKLDTFIND